MSGAAATRTKHARVVLRANANALLGLPVAHELELKLVLARVEGPLRNVLERERRGMLLTTVLAVNNVDARVSDA